MSASAPRNAPAPSTRKAIGAHLRARWSGLFLRDFHCLRSSVRELQRDESVFFHAGQELAFRG